jgi:hypothetical protein
MIFNEISYIDAGFVHAGGIVIRIADLWVTYN